MRLPYYVMERLNGQNLRVILQKKGQLELPHAFHIVPGGNYIRQAGASFNAYAYGYLHEISDHLAG